MGSSYSTTVDGVNERATTFTGSASFPVCAGCLSTTVQEKLACASGQGFQITSTKGKTMRILLLGIVELLINHLLSAKDSAAQDAAFNFELTVKGFGDARGYGFAGDRENARRKAQSAEEATLRARREYGEVVANYHLRDTMNTVEAWQ